MDGRMRYYFVNEPTAAHHFHALIVGYNRSAFILGNYFVRVYSHHESDRRARRRYVPCALEQVNVSYMEQVPHTADLYSHGVHENYTS